MDEDWGCGFEVRIEISSADRQLLCDLSIEEEIDRTTAKRYSVI
jgi:hypothetical protein